MSTPDELEADLMHILITHEMPSGRVRVAAPSIEVAKQAQVLKQYIAAREVVARSFGLDEAADAVLRVTEIPRDAKNPTRDWLVIWGENMAKRIRSFKTEAVEGGQGELACKYCGGIGFHDCPEGRRRMAS